MILVADSGSTKTNWCLLQPNQASYFDTEGFNPYFVSSNHIVESLSNHLPVSLDPTKITEIHFYGAGCFEDKAIIIKEAMSRIFSNANSFVGLDLLGSARAVLGDHTGFAAILGTGTNSCIYDGQRIIANIDSLGYLLGDEGSGYYIGRKLLGDYIRGYMPMEVKEEFYKTYGYSREYIMERIYSEKLPNRFCSSFTQFISEGKTNKDYLRNLVKSSFVDFFEGLVTKYDNYKKYTFNCTGSIGFAFKEILSETATDYGMNVGTILKTPIEGLAHYHMLGKNR
jgi:glucosamine kinase